jgi:hypothetical protein
VRTAVLLLASLSGACAAPLLRLPAGPGEPAPDGPAVAAEAMATCRSVTSIVAEGAVSGSIDGQRVRGRLHLGLAAPASARLEAVASFGQPLFILVTHDGEATLLLTRPDRVLQHDSPAAVLEAVTGIPLDPAGLRATLNGCAEAPGSSARRLGDDWRMVAGPGRVLYLHRASGREPWRLIAVVHEEGAPAEWRVEYRDFEGAFPRTLRFVSRARDRFDVRIELSQVERNTQLAEAVFELRLPPGADPITLDELRRTGPLRGAGQEARAGDGP